MCAIYNHHVQYISCLFLVFCLLAAGCDTNDKYDQKFNPTRVKLFLPLIEGSWESRFSWTNSERTWVVNDVQCGARHAIKNIGGIKQD